MTTQDSLVQTNGNPQPGNVPAHELKESVRQRDEDSKETTLVDLPEWLRLMVKMIDAENSDEELRRVRRITKMMRYYRGEQRGFWSSTTGEWVTINPDDFEPRDAAMLLINNQIRPMIKALAKEWSRSRSRMKAIGRNDTIQLKGASRFASGLLDQYQDLLMPESFRQVEGKSAFLAGNYLRYTVHDKKAKSRFADVPVTEQADSQITGGYWWCPSCDHEGDLDQIGEDKKCPECGEAPVSVVEPKSQKVSRITKVNQVNVGAPVTHLVDVREVKVHVRARNLAQTPYLRRRRYVMVNSVRQEFPWARIKPTAPSPITKYIQETELASGVSGSQRNSPYNFEAYGNGMGGMTEFVQVWLRPSMYFDLKAKKDLKLGSGEIIKKGDLYIDRFPNGMYASLSGDEILDIRDEVLDDYWAHGAYDKLIESFWGDGQEDLIPMQELVNEMQSLFVENIIYNASPKIIYNPFLIEASMLSNSPSEMTPLSRNAKRDDHPKDAVFQMSGMSLAADVPEAQMAAIETMRTQSGAHLAMQGSNDPRLTTATAMAIARDASVAQLGPPLALKSEVDVTWAKQILRLIQKHWVDGVYDKLLGNYSVQEAKWFKECDIERDLEITVEPGSWTPRTDLEVRNDFLSYITAGGIPLGFANPQIPYEIKVKAAELFRMPIDLDKLQPDIRNAHLRIEQLLAAAEVLMSAGVIDETTQNDQVSAMLVADIPVDTYIDDHATIINTYVGWLKTDPGRFAPVVVHDAVQMLIQMHKQAEEGLQDEQFQQQAKYATAAQAMEGMVANAQQADAEKNSADIQQNAQGPQASPVPMGDPGSKPPQTRMSQAAAKSSPMNSTAPPPEK